MFCRTVVFPPHQSHKWGKKSPHTIFVWFDIKLLILHVVLDPGQKPKVVFDAQNQINLKIDDITDTHYERDLVYYIP